MLKLLITGATGLLGPALISQFSKSYSVYGIYSKNKIKAKKCKFIKADITDKEKLIKTVNKVNPGIIIHAAALADVDLCEKNKKLAEKINVEGTKNIVECCRKADCRLVYISTDFVFDGKKGNYAENDRPDPVNFYGRTKLEAEKLIKRHKDHLIIRTSIYGWNIQKKSNFVEWVIANLKGNKQIGVINDEFTSMILANDLAEILDKMVKRKLNGIYNIAASERISKYDFALKIAKAFNLNKSLIKAIGSSQLKRRAKRPKDASLSTVKSEKGLGIRFPDVMESLEKMKKIENRYKLIYKL